MGVKSMSMRRSAFGFALLIALTGCASDQNVVADESSTQTLRDLGYEQQADFIEDGIVTKTEIENAAISLQACFEKEEQNLVIEGWNPIDNITFLYLAKPGPGTTDSQFSQVYDDCTNRHILHIQNHYRSNTDPHMDPEIMAQALVCLAADGYSYVEDPVSQFDLVDSDFVGSTETPTTTKVDSCVLPAALDLYPDIVTLMITW